MLILFIVGALSILEFIVVVCGFNCIYLQICATDFWKYVGNIIVRLVGNALAAKMLPIVFRFQLRTSIILNSAIDFV